MVGRLRRQWVEMTTLDFQQTDMSAVVVILPVAAIEQHGPHLPVGTDSIIATALCEAASGLTGVPLLPTLWVSSSGAHTTAWPGTVSLTPRGAIAGKTEHAGHNRGCALASLEDFLERLLLGWLQIAAHAQLRVVDDGGQDVVKFVGHAGGQGAYTAQPLGLQ